MASESHEKCYICQEKILRMFGHGHPPNHCQQRLQSFLSIHGKVTCLGAGVWVVWGFMSFSLITYLTSSTHVGSTTDT